MTEQKFQEALATLRANANAFIETGDYFVLEGNKAAWDALRAGGRDDEASQVLTQEALADWPKG